MSVVAIVGAGYVGMPLARTFADAGHEVVLVDVERAVVDGINRGESHIEDVPSEALAALVEKGTVRATTDYDELANADAILIALATPLTKQREPDLSIVTTAVKGIAERLKKGQLVVLESTTYPGTTREELLPRFEARGLACGKDFFLAFSPEREDPGNRSFNTQTIPKVVGGMDAASLDVAVALYGAAIQTVVPVSSPEVAEAAKILENVFRAVNIALANEMKLVLDEMGINVWEVIEAAKTKPFGFMPFYPGPGLGGHCIPSDPFYLSWTAKMNGFDARFIELAGAINEGMPRYVVEKITDALNHARKSIRGSRIHVLGVAYKPGVNDIRESPALIVMRILADKGAVLTYSDPYIPTLRDEGFALDSIELTNGYLGKVDCVVILTDHKEVDYDEAVKTAPLLVDTRNALKGRTASHIVRL